MVVIMLAKPNAKQILKPTKIVSLGKGNQRWVRTYLTWFSSPTAPEERCG